MSRLEGSAKPDSYARMKFDSPHFDKIRIKPTKSRKVQDETAPCQWPGCTQKGAHRAPKGRSEAREYWNFCLDHVREYNSTYNYFDGMSDDDVARYQKDSLTGHRPTWKMGMNTKASRRSRASAAIDGAFDPFSVFSEIGGGAGTGEGAAQAREQRTIMNAERKALRVMGLEASASAEEVRVRFKMLVKQHHPDANGGDRSSEDRLRDIIQAYKYLKSKNFA